MSAVRDYLEAKGDLRPVEVVTCLVIWLIDARGFRSVGARDIHAHYRPHDRPPAAAPVRSVSDALRQAYRARLLAEVEVEAADLPSAGMPSAGAPGRWRVGDEPSDSPLIRGIVVPRRRDAGPRFAPTALGRLVVEALPDKREVGALRGLHASAALYRTSSRLLG